MLLLDREREGRKSMDRRKTQVSTHLSLCRITVALAVFAEGFQKLMRRW